VGGGWATFAERAAQFKAQLTYQIVVALPQNRGRVAPDQTQKTELGWAIVFNGV